MLRGAVHQSGQQASMRASRPKTKNEVRAEKLWSQGVAWTRQKQHGKACECYEQATKLVPGDALYWTNYASALNKLSRSDEAIAACQRAQQLDDQSIVANQLLAQIHRDRREFEQALKILRSLSSEVKWDARHHLLTGTTLSDLGRHQEAIPEFLNCLTLDHANREAYSQMAFSLAKLRQYKQAAECFRTINILEPHALSAALYAPHYRAWACDWDGLDEDKSRLADTIDGLGKHYDDEAISPFCLLSFSDDPALQKWMALWDMQRFDKVVPLDGGTFQKREAGQRIKVGFVSSDFHHHATSMLLVEVLEKLDRQQFEIYLYSHGIDDGSALRQRVIKAADHFIECGPMPRDIQARMIKDHRIDVLYELKGFTLDTRLSMFAYRPAPIQVAWLGYPGTCGASFIDYIIGDSVVTPMVDQENFTECIAQMPWSYQPNDTSRVRAVARSRAECGLPEDALVFGCFNQSYKITRETYDAWARILLRVPRGILWLLVPDEQVRQTLRAEMRRRGVDPARIYFADFEKIDLHRRRLALVDVALDTFPCGGHTTTSDALWAGVPLISLIGRTFASRVAGSLLNAVGLADLTCETYAEYEDKAVFLAEHADVRQTLREHLAASRDSAPLFDSTRYAKDLGDLMIRMVERFDQGLPPAPLAAQPSEETT